MESFLHFALTFEGYVLLEKRSTRVKSLEILRFRGLKLRRRAGGGSSLKPC